MLKRWVPFGLGTGVVLAALTWLIAWGWGIHRRQEILEQASREVDRHQYAPAQRRLAWLSSRSRPQAKVEYLLGVCEQALGHLDAAEAAWARVPAGSPYSNAAASQRAEALVELGRYSVAEEVYGPLARLPGDEGFQARDSLGLLYRYEGRLDDTRRVYEEGWNPGLKPFETLHTLWVLDTYPYPTDGFRGRLGRALTAAPGDDRVWLGLANLEIRDGRFAEADRWLSAAERRRPDDPAVGLARLDWALATGDFASALRTLPRVPADRLSPSRTLALRAWFAARSGDPKGERRALASLLELDPGNTRALERLVVLAVRQGDDDLAAKLRRQKANVDRAKDEYGQRIKHPEPLAEAAQFARLATVLNRRFEMRAWATLLREREPDNKEAAALLDQLDRSEPDRPSPGRTLADLFPDLAPTPGPAPIAIGAKSTGASPAFIDEAEAAGLRFVYDNDVSPDRHLPETLGGGAGLLDYDGDGRLDIYVVQGGPYPPVPSSRNGDRLFRNRGDGTFEDATEAAGLAEFPGGFGMGVAVGDYDNDGRPDLFVTRWGAYALYHNRGGTFEDATEAAGFAGNRDWPTSAAWADLDGDGDLDLYVCHYLRWDPVHPIICRNALDDSRAYCSPRTVDSMPDHLFRNDGGRFVDVTAEAGIVDPDGRGLGVVAADLDGDGKLDLYVANDLTANFLFRNLGGMRFEEVGHLRGVAAAADGGYHAGMGVACGDLDGDGLPDLAVTNFHNESTTFFHNLGEGMFADETAAIGLAAPSRHLLGFGVAFLDVNDDGHLDLATANGHINDLRPTYPYAMPAQLLLGDEKGHLTDVSAVAGAPFQVLRVGRGLAAGDVDNDGRLDLVLVAQTGPLAYFHNRTVGGHSLTLALEGTKSNRDAVGAKVTVEAGGRRLVSWRVGGGSYASASDPRLHFGLGNAEAVEAVEVAWPSGRTDRHEHWKAGSGYLLREGDSTVRPLADFPDRRPTTETTGAQVRDETSRKRIVLDARSDWR